MSAANSLRVFVTGAGGFIGGSIAAGLARRGHSVVGLIRRSEQAPLLEKLGIRPVVGSLEDQQLLAAQAKENDAVVNAASADQRGAVEALVQAMDGSGKTLLHTSGSGIVCDPRDPSGECGPAPIYDEDTLPEPAPEKKERVAIGKLVLDAGLKRGIRSAVFCPSLIYGHGALPGTASQQLPRLVRQAQKSGLVRHVGSGGNVWSNVHIDDLVDAYRLALEKGTPPGTFYFFEAGEASFREMSEAVADALKLGPPQPWPLDEAKNEWGYERAAYVMGSTSRVRAKRARAILGWTPKRTSVIDWIRKEMVQKE
ncbi:hypothetical protein AAVH_23986 [Aphelenchoides avenae]|nr:hypothetical protein AAVH_23986 [Aphelenchus avenae]